MALLHLAWLHYGYDITLWLQYGVKVKVKVVI